MKYVPRYVPERALEEIQKKFKINPLQCKNCEVEVFYFILDLFYRLKAYNKNIKYTDDGSIRISCKLFSKYITKGYASYIHWLINNNIIKCDKIKFEGKAYAYQICSHLESPLVRVLISPDTLIHKRIIENYNRQKKYHKKLPDHIKKMKQVYKKTIRVDLDSAFGWLENQFKNKLININQHNVYLLSLNAINDGELYFKINNTNGRIDSNITNLKSELRQFIVGEFNHIDCQNSQPLIVNFITDYISKFNDRNCCIATPIQHPTSLGDEVEKMLSKELDSKDLSYLKFFPKWDQNSKREFKEFKADTMEKDFYSSFAASYKLPENISIERKDVKEIIYKVFFSKNHSFLKEKKIFKSKYPTIYSIIYNLKKQRHNKFAICLQRIESEIFIQTICKRLVEEGIVPLTIHDSIIIVDAHKERGLFIMNQVYREFLGQAPIFVDKPL